MKRLELPAPVTRASDADIVWLGRSQNTEQPCRFPGTGGVTAELVETEANVQLAQQDAVHWLSGLATESIDLLVTDPPYESLEKHRAVGTTTRLKVSAGSSNPWFTVFPNSRFAELFAQVHRVLKRNSHFYLMCDQETAFIAKPIAEAAGFKFWKPLIWDKCTIGMGYHYRARYEFVLFFEKGKRKLNDLGIADVITVPRVRAGYPAEKPSALSETLILQSSVAGEIVADPFMGSGSVGVAALKLSRHFLGNDVSDSALAYARNRFSQSGGTEGVVLPDDAASRGGQRRLSLVLP